MQVLEFSDVSYSYRRRGAGVFSNFSADLPVGRTALLGPNGAGKSTLMKLAAGIIRPTGRGCVRLHSSETAAMGRGGLGYVPQTPRPIAGLKVKEQVAYAAWLAGVNRMDCPSAAQAALARVDMVRLYDRPSRALSGGENRRMALAECLAASPNALILDEPTVGLDPRQRRNFKRLLLDLEIDYIVTTHAVDDLDSLYDTVVVISEGQILFTGTAFDFTLNDTSGERNAENAYADILQAGGG